MREMSLRGRSDSAHSTWHPSACCVTSDAKNQIESTRRDHPSDQRLGDGHGHHRTLPAADHRPPAANTHTQVATRRVTVVALDSWRRKASLGTLSQLRSTSPCTCVLKAVAHEAVAHEAMPRGDVVA